MIWLLLRYVWNIAENCLITRNYVLNYQNDVLYICVYIFIPRLSSALWNAPVSSRLRSLHGSSPLPVAIYFSIMTVAMQIMTVAMQIMTVAMQIMTAVKESHVSRITPLVVR